MQKMIGLFATLLMVSAIVLPATADDVFDDNHHIFIEMTNGAKFDVYNNGTYYFKFDGGGLNALHITNNTALPYGQVTDTTVATGTFYISDTGGRGFFDDAILMIAVNDTDNIPAGFTVHINASGFNWTPTGGTNQTPPDVYNDVSYVPGAVNENFTSANFTVPGSQIWKPYTNSDYPIFYGEDMEEQGEDPFNLMFIDLKAGLIGTSTPDYTYLEHNGMVKVDYTIYNPPKFLVFNVYGWCNESDQGQGVSWTNALTGEGTSSLGIYSSTVPINEPGADFNANVTTGEAPLWVHFYDTSSNSPSSWNWSFGDGIYSEIQNPIHC